MQNISELKRTSAQPRPQITNNAMSRKSNPPWKPELGGLSRPQARNSQSARRSYERYLVLARAEALTGDRIAAENYYQHAEHYFRSMRENAN